MLGLISDIDVPWVNFYLDSHKLCVLIRRAVYLFLTLSLLLMLLENLSFRF